MCTFCNPTPSIFLVNGDDLSAFVFVHFIRVFIVLVTETRYETLKYEEIVSKFVHSIVGHAIRRV